MSGGLSTSASPLVAGRPRPGALERPARACVHPELHTQSAPGPGGGQVALGASLGQQPPGHLVPGQGGRRAGQVGA